MTIFRAILNIDARTGKKEEVLRDRIGKQEKKYISNIDAILVVSFCGWGTYQLATTILALFLYSLSILTSSKNHMPQGDI